MLRLRERYLLRDEYRLWTKKKMEDTLEQAQKCELAVGFTAENTEERNGSVLMIGPDSRSQSMLL
jgi:hypothetical protein